MENEDGVNAYQAIFDNWNDPEYMYQFCSENLPDIQMKFGYVIDAETAANELMDEAEMLKELLYNLATKHQPETNLQRLFRPLDNRDVNLTVLQLSKGSVKGRRNNHPKLRIYAIRISENTYVVTGGAIKLTNLMQEKEHTQMELDKLKRGKAWLRSEGINYPEDLTAL